LIRIPFGNKARLMEKVGEVEMLLEANTVCKLITPNPYCNLAVVNQHLPVHPGRMNGKRLGNSFLGVPVP
jgi:hypothetical protein